MHTPPTTHSGAPPCPRQPLPDHEDEDQVCQDHLTAWSTRVFGPFYLPWSFHHFGKRQEANASLTASPAECILPPRQAGAGEVILNETLERPSVNALPIT